MSLIEAGGQEGTWLSTLEIQCKHVVVAGVRVLLRKQQLSAVRRDRLRPP